MELKFCIGVDKTRGILPGVGVSVCSSPEFAFSFFPLVKAESHLWVLNERLLLQSHLIDFTLRLESSVDVHVAVGFS